MCLDGGARPNQDKHFFPKLVEYMTSGPVVVMELEGVNAVKVWDKLKGPTDLKKVNKEPLDSFCHPGFDFLLLPLFSCG